MMLFQFPLTQPGGQIQNVMFLLQQWGLLDAFLPFLLLFSLIFAMLQKLAIFSKKVGTAFVPDKKLNGTLAFVIAAMVVVPHVTRSYPPQYDPILIILNILPQAGLLLLTMFLTLVMIGMVAKKPDESISLFVGAAFLILLAVVVVMAIWPAFTPDWLRFDPNLQALAITLLIFGGIVYFITREEPKKEDTWTKALRRLFGFED
jgi:hypothetical protein